MSTLCWLNQKDHLLSSLSTNKKQHATKIDEFIKQYHLSSLTNFFYFFIVNSFFSTCEYTDIDIVLIPKTNIDDKILEELNIFFKNLKQLNLQIDGTKKTFDVQMWNIDLNTFLKNYNFVEPITFGEHIFEKYSGENVSALPGVQKINDYLYKRQSQIFTQKHLDRQQEGIVYSPPVSLFEIEEINFNNYIDDLSRIMLFDRIINTNNFPKSCDLCKRISDGYIKELTLLLEGKGRANCSSCVLRSLRNKYLQLFLQVLDKKIYK
jgi:hypothetical protein